MRGPLLWQVDMVTSKRFDMPWRNGNFEFRAEFFNLLNRTNFRAPNGNRSAGGLRHDHGDLRSANHSVRIQGELLALTGSGIRDQGSGIRDQGSGIRDQGSGIRDQRIRVRWPLRPDLRSPIGRAPLVGRAPRVGPNGDPGPPARQNRGERDRKHHGCCHV